MRAVNPGMRTWPPWVWPAKISDGPYSAARSATLGTWVSTSRLPLLRAPRNARRWSEWPVLASSMPTTASGVRRVDPGTAELVLVQPGSARSREALLETRPPAMLNEERHLVYSIFMIGRSASPGEAARDLLEAV